MKKLIAILFLALCSLALATPAEPVAHPADNVALADSVIIDSAMYYDSLAARMQYEGDSLMNEATSSIGFGLLMGVVGGVGTIWSFGAGSGASLEGGGAAVVIIGVPSVFLLLGGVFGLLEGVGTGAKADMKIRKAEEYRNSAGQYRTNSQQVKVDFVPLVDPVNKSVGGLLALGF
jgi:hypothetical protein